MTDKYKDYYKTLGISRDAGKKEIQTAYRRLAKECHPDLHDGLKRKEEMFKEIQEAYETLKDVERRRKYDEELAQSEAVRNGAFIDISQLDDIAWGDEEFDWINEFFGNSVFAMNQVQDDLEIVLSKKEAKSGGQIAVDLPSYFGLGFGFSPSLHRKFNLRIPAGVAQDTVKNYYIPEHDFWIRVRFRVS